MNRKKIKKLKKKLGMILELIERMYEIVENLIHSTDEIELMQQYIVDFNEISHELEIRNEDIIEKFVRFYWKNNLYGRLLQGL